MAFEPIKKILPRVVGSHKMTMPLKARSVLIAASKALSAAWGDERASTVTPVSFHDAELTVESSSAGAAQQLRIDEARLLNDINRNLGERCVMRLMVRRRGF